MGGINAYKEEIMKRKGNGKSLNPGYGGAPVDDANEANPMSGFSGDEALGYIHDLPEPESGMGAYGQSDTYKDKTLGSSADAHKPSFAGPLYSELWGGLVSLAKDVVKDTKEVIDGFLDEAIDSLRTAQEKIDPNSSKSKQTYRDWFKFRYSEPKC
jgi:hypothetical protein